MARPPKSGLLFFYHDVEMHDHFNVRRLMHYHKGGNAYAIYVMLLELIYKEGYYIKVDKFLIFNLVSMLQYEDEFVKDVLNACVENELFDRASYENDEILTSYGIQRRYIKIAIDSHRRVSADLPFLLKEIISFFNLNSTPMVKSDKTPVKSDITPVKSDITPAKSDITPAMLDNDDQSLTKFETIREKLDETQGKLVENTHRKGNKSTEKNSSSASCVYTCKGKAQDAMITDEERPIRTSEGIQHLRQDKKQLLYFQRETGFSHEEILDWLTIFLEEWEGNGQQFHEGGYKDIVKHTFSQLKIKKGANEKPQKSIIQNARQAESLWNKAQAALMDDYPNIAQLFEDLRFHEYGEEKGFSIITLKAPSDMVKEEVKGKHLETIELYMGRYTSSPLKVRCGSPQKIRI